MAKATFHRNQKVWVESVGAWAVIEKIVPVWAKGFDEPIKITYDVGFGRDFQAEELRGEEDGDESSLDQEDGVWRILRARNKWQTPEDCVHHPFPGTFPVVVTDRRDWGGWRVPGAEYDRDPGRFERQARLLAAAPKLYRMAAELHALVTESPDDAPPELRDIATRAANILRSVMEVPTAPGPRMSESETPPPESATPPAAAAAAPRPAQTAPVPEPEAPTVRVAVEPSPEPVAPAHVPAQPAAAAEPPASEPMPRIMPAEAYSEQASPRPAPEAAPQSERISLAPRSMAEADPQQDRLYVDRTH